MTNVILLVLGVLLANVSGWGACVPYNKIWYGVNPSRCQSYLDNPTVTCKSYLPCNNGNECYVIGEGNTNRPTSSCWGAGAHIDCVSCDTKCEADSLKGCDDEHIWNQDSCKCVPKPPTESDSTFTICDEQFLNGRTYSTIYKVTCHYRDGNLETCCGVSPNKINDTGYKSYCPIYRSNAGSCADNGVPNGPSPPHEGNQVPEGMPTASCYATVGSTCYFQDFLSGRTYSCECDGDCQKAQRDAAVGYGSCVNPYPQYSSSSGGGGEGGNSSGSEGGNSSGSEGGNSSGSGSDKDYTQQLNQIIANTQGIMDNTGDISQWSQETMNQTIDIKNQLTETSIDVSHIRTNTENTAQNTSNIDNKLSTTNNLLQQIKDKDWSPDVHVNPNVTVVDSSKVEVNVTTDTAKAPSEILGFLKGLFGGMDTTANYDTTGWGSVNDSAKAQLDSALKKGDWVTSLGCDTTGGHRCDNSIIGAHGLDSAKSGLKSTYRALSDTLRNGAFGDSLQNWSSKFTAGNISGSGSDNCPTVISRNYHIELVQGAGFDLTLGRFLCHPLVGNITGWALCRLLLRASVALACMWFLFHCATGFGGRGGNDD